MNTRLEDLLETVDSRAGTLGGCTSHNAMIFVYPSNQDWDQIADLMGDPSWLAALRNPARAAPHPLFRVVRGGIADWKAVRRRRD